MNTKPMDITPDERKLLSNLKKRPGMYLGKAELSRFVNWSMGYDIAMYITKQNKEHNILPGGLHEYAAMKYLGHTETAEGWFTLILQNEPNEQKALQIFFNMLDKYLISLGYEPIPDLNEEFSELY